LKVLRGLLDHGAADLNGMRLRFHDWDRPCSDLDRISLEVAASNPLIAALAGELGDGLMTYLEIRPDRLSALRDAAIAAAVKAGRPTDNFPFMADIGPLCLVRHGEAPDSPRITAMAQPRVSSRLSGWLMSETDPDDLQEDVRDAYVRFRAWAHAHYGHDPAVVRWHLSEYFTGGRKPEHDQFLSPGVIRALALTGPADEIAEQLREIRRVGVTDLAVQYPANRPFVDPDHVADLVTIREMIG
jgi:alkanesulfonate monooxygenase SsuD/methylene tetrahydromethanopterin reductase-like flavin-dependent oxidoreductase (luciferase family)